MDAAINEAAYRALLGLFNINLLHNLVHIVIGIAGHGTGLWDAA